MAWKIAQAWDNFRDDHTPEGVGGHSGIAFRLLNGLAPASIPIGGLISTLRSGKPLGNPFTDSGNFFAKNKIDGQDTLDAINNLANLKVDEEQWTPKEPDLWDLFNKSPFGQLWNKSGGGNVDPFINYLQSKALERNALGQIEHANAALRRENAGLRDLAEEQAGVEGRLQNEYDRAAAGIQHQDQVQARNIRKQRKADARESMSDLDQIMARAQMAVAGRNVDSVAEEAVNSKAAIREANAAANRMMSDIDSSGANAIAATRASGAKRSGERKQEINDAMVRGVTDNRRKMAENMKLLPQLMASLADTAMGRDIQRAQLQDQRAGMMQSGVGSFMDYMLGMQKLASGGSVDPMDAFKFLLSGSGVSTTTTDDQGNEITRELPRWDTMDPESSAAWYAALGQYAPMLPSQSTSAPIPMKPKDKHPNIPFFGGDGFWH